MDVKGKTKDNMKARLDIALYCNHKNMELVYDKSRVAKPRASFVLEKNAQLLVYKWLNLKILKVFSMFFLIENT